MIYNAWLFITRGGVAGASRIKARIIVNERGATTDTTSLLITSEEG